MSRDVCNLNPTFSRKLIIRKQLLTYANTWKTLETLNNLIINKKNAQRFQLPKILEKNIHNSTPFYNLNFFSMSTQDGGRECLKVYRHNKMICDEEVEILKNFFVIKYREINLFNLVENWKSKRRRRKKRRREKWE